MSLPRRGRDAVRRVGADVRADPDAPEDPAWVLGRRLAAQRDPVRRAPLLLARCDELRERWRTLASGPSPAGVADPSDDPTFAVGTVVSLLLLRSFRAAAAGLLQLRGRHAAALVRVVGADPAGDGPVAYEIARVRARALWALGRTVEAHRQMGAALTLASASGWHRRAGWVRAEFGSAGLPDPAARAEPPQPVERGGGDDSRVRLYALRRLVRVTAGIVDPDRLARAGLSAILDTLDAGRAQVYLADGGGLRPWLRHDRRPETAHLAALSGGADVARGLAASARGYLDTGAGSCAVLVAPLEIAGRPVGALRLDRPAAAGVFVDADLDLLAPLVDHLAGALDGARAGKLAAVEGPRRARQDVARALRDAVADLGAATGPEQVLSRLLEAVPRVLPADRVRLIRGGDGGDRDGASVVSRDAVPGWLAVPLALRGEPDAQLLVGSTGGLLDTAADLDALAVLADHAVATYANAVLVAENERVTTADPLTGVANRGHFTELARRHIAIAARGARPLLIGLVDIDHLGRVNTRYGRATGDEVIRTVATALRANVREYDLLARFADDSFALLLPEMQGDPAAVTEALRAAVAASTTGICEPAGELTVTVSLGFAQLGPGDDLERLLNRAAQALSLAKAAGRNQQRPG